MSEINFVSKVDVESQFINNTKQSKVAKNGTFQSHMKNHLDEASKTVSLDDIFQRASEKYNVSVNLLKAIGKAESNFDANAVSPSGAQGVMQLMPRTAESLGVTDSFDPEQNIMGGSKYISDLLKKYDGDVNLALAAYNAGMGNVAKYGGIPPFDETQNYVVKVNKFMQENIKTGTADTRHLEAPNTFNTNYVSSNTSDSSRVNETVTEKLLAELFSYQDYLRFLDIFLELEWLDSE